MRNDERWHRRNSKTAWGIQPPSAPQEVDYLHWLNQKAIAETVLSSVSDVEKQPLLDLLELNAVRGSEYHYEKHGRRTDAEQFEAIKQKMIAVGAPASIEFMGDMEAMSRYTLFLNSRYPALDWSAVRFTYIENPIQPHRPDTLLPNEWLLDIDETAKLAAILTHDVKTVLGEKFNPDMDYLFQRWFMVGGGMNDLHIAYRQALELPDNKPVSGVSSSLDAIAKRAEYYAGNIELLATHNRQFYPSQNPYEPLVSWNPYETQIMRLMVTMERHYDWLYESLTNGLKMPVHQQHQNPLARLRETNGQPAKNRENTVTFEASPELSTSDLEKDTKQSTPAENREPRKVTVKPVPDGKTLLESGQMVFTTQEAAVILSLSVKQVTALCRSNELPAVKIGRGYRIKRENIEKLTEQRYTDPINDDEDKYDDDMGF